jgi:hypothetical protein
LGATEGLMLIKYGGNLRRRRRGWGARMILRRSQELPLGIEDAYFCIGSSCVQTGNPGQGSRVGAPQMHRQQAGFAHQGLLCLLAQGLLHDLAQGKIKDRHPQEKDQDEGEE